MNNPALRLEGKDRIPRWRSTGRSLLLFQLKTKKAVEIARQLHVTRAAVSAWSRGLRRPQSYQLRMRIQHELGIPASMWDVYSATG